MAQESAFDLLHVDDFYFSLLFDENEEQILPVSDEKYAEELQFQEQILPVSDEKYAEELQFQETLMASVITSQMANSGSSSSSPMEIQASPNPNQEPVLETDQKDVGESSQSFCEICVERKGSDEMFKSDSCCHSFCSDCITKHVVTKIQESISIVTCPGLDCKAMLELETCRPILPKDVLGRWDEAHIEALILASQKFYCPFKDCSAMLVNDNEEGEVIRESECPICHRLFCAQCRVPWHSGIECEELQILNEDERGSEDLMVRELAKEKNGGGAPTANSMWRRLKGAYILFVGVSFNFAMHAARDGLKLMVVARGIKTK